MDEVITFVEPESYVSRCYKRLARATSLTARPTQVALSEGIANALIGNTPIIAEAPTGTGKTLAYLIGALGARHVTGHPIVVATATKALQQQLMTNDLPRMFAASLLTPEDVAIAKGKSNYICIENARQVLDSLAKFDVDPEAFISDKALQGSAVEIEGALSQLETERWRGDFDLLASPLTLQSRRVIAVSSETCTGKKCPEYKNCAYYKAKAAAQSKSIIITNQDLLLMDLTLVSEDSEPTLPVANYYLVVDEGHHLPAKAISVGSFEAPLTQLLNILPKLQGVQKIIRGSPELQKLLLLHHLEEASFDKSLATMALRTVIFNLMDTPVDDFSMQFRFVRGVLPEPLPLLLSKLEEPLNLLLFNLKMLTSVIKDSDGLSSAVRDKAREIQQRAIEVRRMVDATMNCLAGLKVEKGYAKWLFKKEDSVVLHCAPLEGAEVLKKLLWSAKKRVLGTAILSATITDQEGFGHYSKKVGSPPNTVTMKLPHTFEYSKSSLVVVGMQHSPKHAERKLFIPELISKLPERLPSNEGSLVVFPSWALLNELAPRLKSAFGNDFVKVQGEEPPQGLIARHKEALDKGKGSMLLGVATMGEGLDLPGKYCTHLAIIALPFLVPTDPVEQEISDMLGSRYFKERSLPEAIQRLNQLVGRLIRRESDWGTITVFDHRLGSTYYGTTMLKSLPPFSVTVEKVARY